MKCVKGDMLSVFSLGTAQLGMPHGFASKGEMILEEKAFQILDKAVALGVNNIDTANNYGTSETVIGHWLEKRKREGEALPWISTKIGPLKHGSFDILRDDVLRQVEDCRRKLGVETIECLMLHEFDDYSADPDALQKIFQELKAEKLCHRSAISVCSHNDYNMIANSGFDAAQIPLNVFDWRQIENGGIDCLKNAGVMIFAHSVFLQGFVFQKPSSLDPRMDFCKPVLKKYLNICKEFRMTPGGLALSFVFSIPGVETVVLGCDNVKQVAANCSLIEQVVHLTPAHLSILHEAFKDTEQRVINPGMWYDHA